jgi:hypothetical protein
VDRLGEQSHRRKLRLLEQVCSRSQWRHDAGFFMHGTVVFPLYYNKRSSNVGLSNVD